MDGGGPARLMEAAGNFYERTGHADEARALYTRFQTDNRESATIAAAADRIQRGAPPPAPLISNPTAGLAEALFNVAGALRQDNNELTALVYGRLALALVPDMPVDLLLVADLLHATARPPPPHDIHPRIPASSPL